MIKLIYNGHMFKKLMVLVSFLLLASFINPALSRAQDVQTCTTVTQYGGAVSYICGASTHAPVATGLGESLPIYAMGFLLVSSILYLFSKKINLKYQGGENI